MRALPIANKLTFDEISKLLLEKPTPFSHWNQCTMGEGAVQIFRPEKGLQVKLWQCTFSKEVKVYSPTTSVLPCDYFTIGFFLRKEGLLLESRFPTLTEAQWWDTILFSSSFPLSINVRPFASVRCLSVSFSRYWMDSNVLKNDRSQKEIQKKMDLKTPVLLLHNMNEAEKAFVTNLMNASSLHVYGSFYLRSRILSLLWEFFNQAKVSGFSIHKDGKPDSPEVTIEQHLVAHIRGHFPNLRDFASQYCLSEETLKRRFKKRYGMSMYQYFINKKMEYAFKLLQQQGLSLPEVARMIGYKKPYPFIKMFDRYVNTSSASG